MTRDQAIWYEVAGSWWARKIGWRWGQRIAGRYFALKVARKLRRMHEMGSKRNVLTKVAVLDATGPRGAP